MRIDILILSVSGREGISMLQEFARFVIAWGAMAGIVVFWYWMLSNIGTF